MPIRQRSADQRDRSRCWLVDQREIRCLCSRDIHPWRPSAVSRITALETADVRFPTSLSLDGSDAMNPDPDYSAAYLRVCTDARDDIVGHGFVFTIGRGRAGAGEKNDGAACVGLPGRTGRAHRHRRQPTLGRARGDRLGEGPSGLSARRRSWVVRSRPAPGDVRLRRLSGTTQGRLIEFVDHLHEHFVTPVDVHLGRYVAPTAPGAGTEMLSASIAEYSMRRHD
jgi:L-alanine-DL-glutamate epimerase-like enolase superfamily enzyme